MVKSFFSSAKNAYAGIVAESIEEEDSEEEKRDVASAVIGKENTVPAFGFSFYQTKNPRIVEQPTLSRGFSMGSFTYIKSPAPYLGSSSGDTDFINDSTITTSCYFSQSAAIDKSGWEGAKGPSGNASLDSMNYVSEDIHHQGASEPIDIQDCMKEVKSKGVIEPSSCQESRSIKEKKDVSVGAGAKIYQELEMDPLGLDDWKDEPSAVIRLYFCFETEFKEIIQKGGVKKLQSKEEGYLDNIPVG